MDVLRSHSSPRTAASGTAAPAAEVVPDRRGTTIEVECRPVRTPAELADHHRIRCAVFVSEQGLFVGNDRDEHDDDPATIHVLGFEDSVPGGTVRLYPTPSAEEPLLWKGDRLAVRSGHRHSGLGGPLVERAVAIAGAAGGSRMVAWVQVVNVRFFEHLGWTAVGEPELYVGEPHQQMSIKLS